MNAAAKAVMADIPDITIAYGVSDEYRQVSMSFLISWFMSLTRSSVLSFTSPACSLSVGQGMP